MYIYEIKRFKRKKIIQLIETLKRLEKNSLFTTFKTHSTRLIRTFTFQRDKSTYTYIYIKNLLFPLVIQIQRTRREMEIFMIVKSSPLVWEMRKSSLEYHQFSGKMVDEKHAWAYLMRESRGNLSFP